MRMLLGVWTLMVSATLAQAADVSSLIKQLKTGDNDTRRLAARDLGEAGADAKEAVSALTAALKDNDFFVRRFAAKSLGQIGSGATSAIPALEKALDDNRKEVRLAAGSALGKMGSAGVSALISLLRNENKDTEIRQLAAESLGRMGPVAHSAVPALTAVVKEGPGGKKGKGRDMTLQVDAINALGELATPADTKAVEALEALVAKKKGGNKAVKQATKTALKKIRRR
jgi:HEAT repeat protein